MPRVTSTLSEWSDGQVDPSNARHMVPQDYGLGLVWGKQCLQTEIARWCAARNAAADTSATFFEDRCAPWHASLLSTAANLPEVLRPKEYTIHVTHRICCEASPGDVDLADMLPAVNIILVSAKRSDVYVFNYTAFVCTNFDLIPCCVALTVSPELRFECHGYLGALQAIERKELRANATIFSCSSTCITMQMDRILKYLERGFCWAELGAAVQAREQILVDAGEPEEYPGTSTLRSYDRMRSRRAAAGACGFRHYDYRVECEAQSDNAEDPVRVSLA